VEKTTWDQVIHCAMGLNAIAMERVYAELDRMIRGTSPYRALQLLQQSNLLMWAKEPLTISKYMQLTDNVSNVNLSKIGQLEHPMHRWTVWFISMDLHDQELYVNGRALRMPNSVLQHIAKILGVHNLLRRAQHNELRNEWITAMLRFGYKTGYDWLTIATHCFSYTNDSWITPYVQNGSEWTSKMQVTELKQLNIDGVILMSITGRQGGPWLQRILHRLLYETASGMVQNESIFLQKRALELCNLQTEQEGSDVNG
jgi:tRNA nucleotidyltransferase (CCA-adding enzyme)